MPNFKQKEKLLIDRDTLKVFIVLLVLAVISLFQNCAPPSKTQKEQISEVPIVPPATHPIDTKTVTETTYEPVLMDRYVLKTLFTDVFGPTALSVDTAAMVTNVTYNGSPCSVYEDHNSYDAKGTKVVIGNSMERCGRRAPTRLSANVNPKITVTRQVLMARACSDLSNNQNTLTFAMNKIAPGVLPAVPTPDNNNLNLTVNLFYRFGLKSNQGMLDALKLLFPAAGEITMEHWKSAIYTVCVSSQWQVL